MNIKRRRSNRDEARNWIELSSMAGKPVPATIDHHYYRLMTAVAAALLALATISFFLPENLSASFAAEGGLIETVSAAGYFVCIAALFRETNWTFLRGHFYFVVILTAMALRELDFHVAYTTMSITKSRFYVSPDVPIMEKLAAVLAIGALAWCGTLMVYRHADAFLDRLKRLDPMALGILLAAASAGAAKLLDGIARKILGFGVDIGADTSLASHAFEEILELGVPAFLLISIFSCFPRERQPN